ncbi:hypothetical protein RRG08_055398 [Elysia crispata]|uniref:Uncharacterized protein n=1 Tax=Elysia crispata TaxID=231223 RepID=A0AAE1E3G5_9GAST|nr:hypothetical protein RRG08_055398 [Elysia crispata]
MFAKSETKYPANITGDVQSSKHFQHDPISDCGVNILDIRKYSAPNKHAAPCFRIAPSVEAVLKHPENIDPELPAARNVLGASSGRKLVHG